MKPEELLSQITPKYGLDDVQSDAVETVSVLDFEELETLIGKAVEARTKSLMDELAVARKELTSLAASGGDGLEAEAAEAALEAEGRALEAKAEAEQSAAAAESLVAQLQAQLKDLEDEAPSGGDTAELSKLQEELESEKSANALAKKDQEAAESAQQAAEDAQQEALEKTELLEKQLLEAQTNLEGAEKELEAAKASPAPVSDEPPKPIGDSELKHARRLAEAFLEEVFMDDEAKSNTAIADGDAPKVFEKEIAGAYKQYVKRVGAAVRAEGDLWDEVLEESLKREW